MDKLKIYLKLPKKLREKILLIDSNRNLATILNKRQEINLLYEQDKYIQNWGEYEKNRRKWYKAFKKLSYMTKDGIEVAKYFYLDKIKVEKINYNDAKVILICLVKDDLKRIKKLIEHYTKIGIEKFAIIDNGSSDGTYEFLKKQNQVDLFQIKEEYSTIRRQSWINRIISYYGYNKWYLIVDSDELLVYNEMEKNNINHLIQHYELEKIVRCRALMIDMYPQKFLMEKNVESDYTDIFKYFDTDTYTYIDNKYFECITGGMRGRVFKKENDIFKVALVKYPLIYFQVGDIQYNSHYSFPFYKNFGQPLNLGILHYKFLPEDLNRIYEIIEKSNFADGSKEYKRYIEIYEKDKDMNLMYEGTKIYKSSNSIYEIKQLKKVKWENNTHK